MTTEEKKDHATMTEESKSAAQEAVVETVGMLEDIKRLQLNSHLALDLHINIYNDSNSVSTTLSESGLLHTLRLQR